MTRGFTIEHVRRVWIDGTGDRFEVGDDGDGLDMTEIRWMRADDKRGPSVAFTDEQLPALIEVLQARLDEIKARGTK